MSTMFIGRHFINTKEKIAQLRNINIVGSIDFDEVSCVYNRAAQLCILDVLLAKHREEHGNQFNGLNGINALHHKLLLKYKWPLDQIRALTISDCLLALHEELKLEALDDQIANHFKNVLSQYGENYFPDILDGEWDPDAYQLIQDQRRW